MTIKRTGTRRVVALPANRRRRVITGEDIHRLLWPYFVGLDREHLWRVDLDSGDFLLGAELVSIGTVNGTLAHPREILGPALVALASSIVLAHNHPSGRLEPSRRDMELVSRLSLCGALLGIDVRDHLIVHDGDYLSLREAGYLKVGAGLVRV